MILIIFDKNQLETRKTKREISVTIPLNVTDKSSFSQIAFIASLRLHHVSYNSSEVVCGVISRITKNKIKLFQASVIYNKLKAH